MLHMEYIGDLDDGNLTIGKSYEILMVGFVGCCLRGALIDDNGLLYQTRSHLTDATQWKLESVP